MFLFHSTDFPVVVTLLEKKDVEALYGHPCLEETLYQVTCNPRVLETGEPELEIDYQGNPEWNEDIDVSPVAFISDGGELLWIFDRLHHHIHLVVDDKDEVHSIMNLVAARLAMACATGFRIAPMREIGC